MSKRRKVKPSGPQVFTPDEDRERPPAFPVRAGDRILKCRGDGPMRRGAPWRDRTLDYGEAEKPPEDAA